MPIISQPAAPSPDKIINRRLRAIALETLVQMESVYEEALKNVFSNRLGLSAQEVCDALGTDAKELFLFFNSLKQTVEQYTGKTLTPVSNYGSVTLNPDGTVTVNSVV